MWLVNLKFNGGGKVKATARVEDVKVFKPITVSVTLETQGDVDAFYALFNHERIRRNCGWTPEQTKSIRIAIEAACGCEPDRSCEVHSRLMNP
jgi:hypothetical protein